MSPETTKQFIEALPWLVPFLISLILQRHWVKWLKVGVSLLVLLITSLLEYNYAHPGAQWLDSAVQVLMKFGATYYPLRTFGLLSYLERITTVTPPSVALSQPETLDAVPTTDTTDTPPTEPENPTTEGD